jgi:hypothetical protein
MLQTSIRRPADIGIPDIPAEFHTVFSTEPFLIAFTEFLLGPTKLDPGGGRWTAKSASALFRRRRIDYARRPS